MTGTLRTTLLLLALAAPAAAQRPGGPVAPVELAGPRLGVTALTGAVADSIRSVHGISPVITQFGWQVEHRFYAGESGLAGVTELVMLVGGMEQGVALPSATGIVGLRTARGTEVGVGPSLSVLGVGLVLAGGATLRAGELNFPVNLAVVPARNGTRVSLLTGFNMERAGRRRGPWGGWW